MQMPIVDIQATNRFLKGQPLIEAEKKCGHGVGNSCNFSEEVGNSDFM